MLAPDLGDLLSAPAAGRAGAFAVDVQRDLRRWTSRYPDLFPLDVFDGSLLSAVSLANVFAAPWLEPERHRAASRAAVWTFALDRWVDGQGASAASVTELGDTIRRALAGAATEADPPLVRSLVELHDDLRAAVGYADHEALWRAELHTMIRAMARERAWLESGRVPSVRAYLANANSLAFVFVFATHLVSVCTPPRPPGTNRLVRAARIAQRALRLTNDLATGERDVLVGDLNVLGLGVTREAVVAEIERLSRVCRAELVPLRESLPRLSAQLDRQLSYNLSFYAVGDYWAVDPVGAGR